MSVCAYMYVDVYDLVCLQMWGAGQCWVTSLIALSTAFEKTLTEAGQLGMSGLQAQAYLFT